MKPRLQGLSQLRLFFLLPQTPSNTLAGCNISSPSSLLFYMQEDMDDTYGCLRGVKITPELVHLLGCESGQLLDLSPGEVEKVIDHLLALLRLWGRPAPRRISHRLSCQAVFENDGFQEMRLPTLPTAHLRKRLREWKIDKRLSLGQISFLGNLIAQFQERVGRSVNYACFLHNYFNSSVHTPA